MTARESFGIPRFRAKNSRTAAPKTTRKHQIEPFDLTAPATATPRRLLLNPLDPSSSTETNLRCALMPSRSCVAYRAATACVARHWSPTHQPTCFACRSLLWPVYYSFFLSNRSSVWQIAVVCHSPPFPSHLRLLPAPSTHAHAQTTICGPYWILIRLHLCFGSVPHQGLVSIFTVFLFRNGMPLHHHLVCTRALRLNKCTHSPACPSRAYNRRRFENPT